jgi:hypothetical protein
MEQDKSNIFSPKDNRVGGADLFNLLSSNNFMSSKNKVVNLSFEIKDIVIIEDSEILKLTLTKYGNGRLVVRIMKYLDDQDRPSATFDIIDEENKTIVLSSDQDYVGGLGIEKYFHKIGIITQWEIPIFTKLCRGFVLGDHEVFQLLVKDYYLKFSKESERYLKNRLGIPL